MDKVIIEMRVAVHPIKAALWRNRSEINSDMSLRDLCKLIGIENQPQKMKHHLQAMVSMGTIDYVGGKYVFPSGAHKAPLTGE